jgi:hopene-associated glycosyltransferase HpnB
MTWAAAMGEGDPHIGALDACRAAKRGRMQCRRCRPRNARAPGRVVARLSTLATVRCNSFAMVADILLTLACLSFGAWSYLLAFHGGFWRVRERLDGAPGELGRWPAVTALVPARNEADVIGACITGLLQQDYPGSFRVLVVDDHSDDGTAAAAERAAVGAGGRHGLAVTQARPLEPGWAGKVWALSQAHAAAERDFPDTEYYWLTDADIAHDALNLRRLAAKAEKERLDLVSQMVMLSAEGPWAAFLIPAFVLFFQKLYPFAWANDPRRRTAAAAGGSMLLRRGALARIGGFAAIRGAIIDDCALARAVKDHGRDGGGRIWLGLTTAAESLRPYRGLAGVWRMVARSAFTQLRYSILLLAGTVAGMALLYWGVPLLALTGLLCGATPALRVALAAWGLMSFAFAPTLRLYGRSPLLAPLLPLAGFLYSLMTVGSAAAYWRGRGGAWKGRTLPADEATSV